MPVYEYKCKKCGVFEATQRITEAPLKKCPTCRGKVERLVSHSSFILKGSGWYATDYAHKGASSAPAESTPTTTNGAAASASSSDSSTSSSSDSKPASKPAAEKTTAAKTAD
jgi:putative FmdB family regulatory protein